MLDRYTFYNYKIELDFNFKPLEKYASGPRFNLVFFQLGYKRDMTLLTWAVLINPLVSA